MASRVYTVTGNTEVAGITVLSFVDNISSGDIVELRNKHGLATIDTEKWYPLQQIFDLFTELEAAQGTSAFVAMGMKIAEQSEFPPEMIGQALSLQQILEGWQAHYEANHQGDPLPPTETIKVDENHYQIQLPKDHAYPYDLVYGMAYGFCKLLLPKGTRFRVFYDDDLRPNFDGEQASDVLVNITWDSPE